jgi:hypothetical protein
MGFNSCAKIGVYSDAPYPARTEDSRGREIQYALATPCLRLPVD